MNFCMGSINAFFWVGLRAMKKFFWLFLCLLGACSSNPATQFYMLNAETGSSGSAATAVANSLLLGLGPIHVPDYLNRPQIVVEVGENQFRLDEQHRWAERLDQNIDRTLAKFLADRLGLPQVIRFPWAQRQVIDYQISIDILEFHQTAAGFSRLAAQWQIKPQAQAPLSKRFDCSIAAKAEPEAIVKAQSACLGQLGADIETGLRQLLALNKIAS